MAAGHGQYGVLGDGVDHSYNAKDCECTGRVGRTGSQVLRCI